MHLGFRTVPTSSLGTLVTLPLAGRVPQLGRIGALAEVGWGCHRGWSIKADLGNTPLLVSLGGTATKLHYLPRKGGGDQRLEFDVRDGPQ